MHIYKESRFSTRSFLRTVDITKTLSIQGCAVNQPADIERDHVTKILVHRVFQNSLHNRLLSMALGSDLWSLLTVGNVLLSVLFLLLLHYLVEFYQFRGMPPGPRLYSIPFFGNFLSFDGGDGKLSLRESTQR